MARRLDGLLTPLVDASLAAALPLRGDGPDGLRERLHDALSAALRAVPRPGVAPDRLDPASLREDAVRLVRGASGPDALVEILIDLLRQVREADQREAWIQQGYEADTRAMFEEMTTAQQEAAVLRHAVRLVKRATRDVKVGRE